MTSTRTRTVPVARAFAADRPWLRLVKNRYGRGVVAAIRTGFEEVSRGPALVIMADLSDDLHVVPELHGVVPPGQSDRLPEPLRPRRPSDRRAAVQSDCSAGRPGLSLRFLARFPTHDATNNFRLYDAALVNELGIESTGGFELALELTAKAFVGA